MQDITLEQLLEAGSHFGHQIRRWNPTMKKYIYGERDGIHILDLAQTKAGLEDAANYLKEMAAAGKIILFVGTKRQAADIVKQAAINAGVPFMTERWIGGLLTNFEQMSKRVRKMKQMIQGRADGDFKKYTKREQLLIDREIVQLQKFFGGIADMDRLPDVLFIVDAHKEEVAVAEATRLHIPVVAMVDTNGRGDLVDRVIPINDDAAKSIELAVNYIGAAVSEGKNTPAVAKVEEVVVAEVPVEVKAEEKVAEKPKAKKKAVKKAEK